MKVRVQNPTTATLYVDVRVVRNGQSLDTRIAVLPRAIQWLQAESFLGLDQHGTRFPSQPQLKVLEVVGLTPTATQEKAQKVADMQARPLASEVGESKSGQSNENASSGSGSSSTTSKASKH